VKVADNTIKSCEREHAGPEPVVDRSAEGDLVEAHRQVGDGARGRQRRDLVDVAHVGVSDSAAAMRPDTLDANHALEGHRDLDAGLREPPNRPRRTRTNSPRATRARTMSTENTSGISCSSVTSPCCRAASRSISAMTVRADADDRGA
jgi:hypothetical protein